MLKVGSIAPDFEGLSDSGDKIKLSDFRGKNIVLYFYPKDGSPGCTKEACAFRDNWDLLKDYDCVIIGVSSDSLESHREFKRKYNLPFILVSDPDNKIRELYDAKGLLIPSRVTYLIDKQGVIRLAFSSQFRPASHVHKVLEVLKEIEKK